MSFDVWISFDISALEFDIFALCLAPYPLSHFFHHSIFCPSSTPVFEYSITPVLRCSSTPLLQFSRERSSTSIREPRRCRIEFDCMDVVLVLVIVIDLARTSRAWAFWEYDYEHRYAEHEHDSRTLSLSATVTNRAFFPAEGLPPSPEETPILPPLILKG